MSMTNVKSAWVNGDLYFYDKDGNEILHIDGTNRKFVVPTGATIEVPGSVLAAADIALAEGLVLVGDAGGAAAAVAISSAHALAAVPPRATSQRPSWTARNRMSAGRSSRCSAPPPSTTMDNFADRLAANGALTHVAGSIVNADLSPTAAIAASKLANYADLAALVGAGLADSFSYIKTDNGIKTLMPAHATKDRGVLVVVHVDEIFADGDTTQLILKIGEADTDTKAFATAVFTNAAAGAYFVTGFKNLATKAIIATLVAAAGTGTGGVSITVFALPNS